MAWCLHEVVAQKDRNFLENCVSISITRDGRRQRLLCRFGGCTDAWQSLIKGFDLLTSNSHGLIIKAVNGIDLAKFEPHTLVLLFLRCV